VQPLKRSVSLVIHPPEGEHLLLVRRPDDDESLPGIWGLPAVTLVPGEDERAAVIRAGREKLGVEVEPLEPLGGASAERAGYTLEMRDWEAAIVAGDPEVPQPHEGTQYVEWKWGEVAELIPGAGQGSLCSRVVLEAEGVEW
jgi:ADP-ribose pyrophosphatase YjhB (NUDIX family)